MFVFCEILRTLFSYSIRLEIRLPYCRETYSKFCQTHRSFFRLDFLLLKERIIILPSISMIYLGNGAGGRGAPSDNFWENNLNPFHTTGLFLCPLKRYFSEFGITQPGITYSKLTIKILEQGVK